MASMSSLSVSSVKEKIDNGEVVYFLTFQFSEGHKWSYLQTVHDKIKALGWHKLPNVDCRYVWFADSEKPCLTKVNKILKKASFDNHICYHFAGILVDVGVLEGTGDSPTEKKPLQPVQNNRLIQDYFSKSPKTGPGIHVGKEN